MTAFTWTIWDTLIAIAGACAMMSLLFRWLAVRHDPAARERARAQRRWWMRWSMRYVLPAAVLVGLIGWALTRVK